jgi:hypothetical protein
VNREGEAGALADALDEPGLIVGVNVRSAEKNLPLGPLPILSPACILKLPPRTVLKGGSVNRGERSHYFARQGSE